MSKGPGISTRSRTYQASQSTYKPYQPTQVVHPKPYEDPLRARPRSYKYKPFKPSETTKIEYKPYTSFHVFEPSNIDPITGRPYRSRKKQEKIEEPKEEEPPKPVPKSVFPLSLGSTVGSTKRTLKYLESLEF